MELLPLGPVLFIDTAGIDDTGELGALRVQKPGRCWSAPTWPCSWPKPAHGGILKGNFGELNARKTPVVVVFNKMDAAEPDAGAAGPAGR
jgi:hypothetical protein